jgi:hypothetical protein
MSRANSTPPNAGEGGTDQADHARAARDRAKTAEEISAQALELAQRARAAGLTSLSLALETAALEAATVCWPGDEIA